MEEANKVKVWVSIAVIVGLVLGGALGMMVYRSLSGGGQEALELRSDLAREGLQLASTLGCVACHTLDGSEGIGPTWLGMYGREERLKNGETVVVDDAYVRESIIDPGAKVVQGYENLMVSYSLSTRQMDSLVAFTRELGNDGVIKSENQ